MDINISVDNLHTHFFTIYSCAGAASLDYLIAESPSYKIKSEIIEFECLVLSQNLFENRLVSQNIIKTIEDKILFRKILSKLFEMYIIECTDEESVPRIEKFIQTIPKRMKDYEKIFSKNGPIEITQVFFNLIFHELETLNPYDDNILELKTADISVNEFNIITKLIRNIFYLVETFFKDGLMEYIKIENNSENWSKYSKNLDKYFE
jgi:hypothetical protein